MVFTAIAVEALARRLDRDTVRADRQ